MYSGTSAIAVPESMCLGAVICMDRCTWAFSRENSPLEVEIGCNPHGRAQTEPELFFHSLAVELRGASPHPRPPPNGHLPERKLHWARLPDMGDGLSEVGWARGRGLVPRTEEPQLAWR